MTPEQIPVFRQQLRGLIERFYAAEVLLQGGGDAVIRQFIQNASDPDFLEFARTELERLRLVSQRDFVSKIAVQLIDRSLAQMP